MEILNKNVGVLIVSLLITIIGYSQNLVPGGVDAGDNLTLDCTTGNTYTLSADFHESHETNARYTVTSIPMDPVNVSLPSTLNADDDYSAAIDLGFTFCFFGDVKTQIVIGDNGLISFNIGAYAGNTNAQYTVPADVPSAQLPLDAVFGAYHDLFINEGGDITYGVTGTAPFRAFVINYRSVAQYNSANGCNDPTTQQIVLHETSNFIDVYLTEKPACTGWQNGRAIVGIQLDDGSGGNFFVAPGRNMSDSPWSVTDEAWRFAPEESGAETYTVEWINNTNGSVISTNADFDVSPTETTTYTSHVTWISCADSDGDGNLDTVEATDEITITVDLPFVVDFGDVNIDLNGGVLDFCVGDPAYTIEVNATSSGSVTIDSYNWYEISDPSTSLGTTDSLTVSSSGVYVVDVTGSDGCVIPEEVVINYNPNPDAGTAVAIAAICDTEMALDLSTGLTGQDAGGTWSDDDGTGGIITGNSYDATGVTAGTYSFTYTVTLGTCPPDTETVQVTVVRSPTAGTLVSPNISLCNTDAAIDLGDGLTGADVGGTWTDDSLTGGLTGNILDATGLATGSYNFTYTVTAIAPCVDSPTTITVDVIAAANAGTAVVIADICDTETALDLSTGLTGQDAGGTWSDDDSTGGLTGNNFDATGLAGTYSFTYTVNPTTPCTVADTETVEVTVVRSPLSGTVTANLQACNTDTAIDLDTGLTGADVGGTWTDDSSTGGLTGNILDATGLATGSYNFTYTVTAIAPCVDSPTTITVDVIAAANAGTAVVIADICDTETALDLSTGLTGQDAGGTWSDDDSTGGLTGNNFDATGLAGTYSFTYTVNPTTPCTVADTETVEVTVVRSPLSGTVTANLQACNTDTAIDLDTGLTGADVGGTWTDDSSTGGLTGNILDATGLATGSYNFTYTVTAIAPCVDSPTTITVDVIAAADAGTAVVIADICDTETALDLSTGLTGQDAGGTWSDDDSTGGLTGNNFDATGLAGTYSFTYTVNPTTPCTVADTETVQVTVVRSPLSGTATANLQACNTDTAIDLDTGLTGADAGGTWTDNSSTGGLTGNLFDATGLATGSYNFTYTVTATAPCVDSPTTITVDVIAAADAGTAVVIADICDTETALDLSTGLTGQDAGGTWSDDDSTGGLTGNNFDATGLAGTYSFTYTVNPTTPCTVADTETVQVTVVRSPLSGTATANLQACNTDTAIDLDTGLTGADAGGTWIDDSSTGGLTGNLFDATGLATGSYNFTYTVTATTPCIDSPTTITVDVIAAANAGTAVAIADICDTETALDLGTGLTGQDAGGTWADDDSTGGLTGNNFDATGLAGTYSFTYTVPLTSPCTAADSETIQITVIRSPDAGEDGDLFRCMTDASGNLFDSLNGTPDTGGTWLPVLASTTGEFNPAVDAAGVYTYTVAGSGVCSDATATVTVTLSEAPIITSVDVVDFSDNNTITVNVVGLVSGTSFGIGDYEYSIDGLNFQSENIIQNVIPGTYTVTVRDVNGCMPNAVINNVIVMGAPSFFTPNNDGKNDYWQLIGLDSTTYTISPIQIFDRFGKIVTVINPTQGQGWDGLHNNEMLPSSDYWFVLSLTNNQGETFIKRGNFSLIRR